MFEKTLTFWRRLVGNAPATTVIDDRRLWVRCPADLHSSIQLADQQDAKVQVKVRDLSIGGANLVIDRPLRPGQMLSVELPSQEGTVRTVLACVVRVVALEEGRWSLGCVFSRELTEDDLGAFGDQNTTPANDDNRTWVRFTCSCNASYRKVGDTTGPIQNADVLNISANGIALAVQPTLEAGALLNVDLLDKQGRAVKSMLACVVHTKKRDGGDYVVGCNFIRELTEDELQSLL